MSNKLELRMYGLVNYQLTGIQKGIQFLHAVVEYSNLYNDQTYKDWAINNKTVILLNGGTTNNREDEHGIPFGSLNKHKNFLDEIGIKNSSFYEEDLGDQLTCVAFIVDERVFNKKNYPDFEDWLVDNYSHLLKSDLPKWKLAQKIKESTATEDIKLYNKWVSLVGGERNIILRDFLKNFRLA